MAYVPKRDEKDQDQSRQGQPQTVPGTETGAMLPQNAPTATAANGGASGFTDVNQYLDANREQGERLGEMVAQDVSNTGQQAQGAIDDVSGVFKSSVDAGTMRPDAKVVEQAAQSPDEFAKDQAKADLFKNTFQGVYNGPSKLEELPDFTAAQTKKDEAKRVFGLAGSSAGQRELVGRLQKNPTGGMMAFDQLIFGQNPNAVQKVNDTVAKFGDLDAYLSGKKADVQGYADQAAADRAAAQKMIADRFTGSGGVMPEIRNSVQAQVAAKRAALQGMINSYRNGSFADYQWTPEELQAVGLTAADLADIDRYGRAMLSDYGSTINPADYFTQTAIPEEVTDANVITPEQAARYNALASLIGVQNDFITPEQRAAASPVPSKLGDLNRDALLSSVRGTLSSRDQESLDAITAQLSDKMKSTIRVAYTGGSGDVMAPMSDRYAEGYDPDTKMNYIVDKTNGRRAWSGKESPVLQRIKMNVQEAYESNGLSVPDLSNLTGRLNDGTLVNDFAQKMAEKVIGGKSGVVSRTKYDPMSSYRSGRSSFGSGGGYGVA